MENLEIKQSKENLESLVDMRSIWTRVQSSEHDMNKFCSFYSSHSQDDEADQIQTPETGGGEGSQAPQAEVKTIPETQKEVKAELTKEETNEVKPEEPKNEKPEAANVQVESPKEDVKNPEIPVELSNVQPEQPKEGNTEEKVQENKIEADESKPNVDAKAESNGVPESSTKESVNLQERESELLKKIDELEKVKKERTQDSLMLELKVREEEIELLRARVTNLETSLQAALAKPSGKNHEMIQNIKQQHEELLSKARGMIFDKTKMVKNQELQIEALNSQVVSLKDINQITKDLLEIRNSEIQAMEERLAAMEARFKAEKERYALVLSRAQTSSNINDDLRKEYETQLALFKQLREKYDQRVQALVAENEKLKASLPQPANGASSSN